MDEQIRKVRSAVRKGKKAEALKDISTLLKMDKKYDKALDKCGVKHSGKGIGQKAAKVGRKRAKKG